MITWKQSDNCGTNGHQFRVTFLQDHCLSNIMAEFVEQLAIQVGIIVSTCMLCRRHLFQFFTDRCRNLLVRRLAIRPVQIKLGLSCSAIRKGDFTGWVRRIVLTVIIIQTHISSPPLALKNITDRQSPIFLYYTANIWKSQFKLCKLIIDFIK